MDIIRWGLGSTVVKIAEEYIYGQPQVDTAAHFFLVVIGYLFVHSLLKHLILLEEFIPETVHHLIN